MFTLFMIMKSCLIEAWYLTGIVILLFLMSSILNIYYKEMNSSSFNTNRNEKPEILKNQFLF